MAEVLPVVAAGRWGMRQDDVGAAGEERLQPELSHRAPHLTLRVLMWSIVVAVRPLEAGNLDASPGGDSPVDVLAPVIAMELVAAIVIAAHVEDGHVQVRAEEVQVLGGKIAARKDEIDVA